MNRALAALRIGFIGAGRVAQTLAPAFARAGLNVAAFHNRGADAAQRLGSRIPSAGR
ncbi:NAD(P)-binding domain-containing protein [Bradyrhizobium elkanii]|uniref:NAD(P)-binding domain-containing protein n=1 Tax=Bradyrhizobium elkanii TaxID=29448 RepID=UPI0027148E68|nr:NAD(P)-binding domain-containing protein [Bradyrhizobium elkanii]WLB06996.1 NAD(P)-binding domain-containing protein [Bradyrhizobium elkanii]